MLTVLLAIAGPLPPILPDIGAERPPWGFEADDEALLESAQFGAFRALTSVTAYGGMVRDATNSPVISMAGVGFQLAALALAPEHGWLTEAEAETQALNILQEILNTPNIAKHGLYYHWIDATTAAKTRLGWFLPWIPRCSMPGQSWPVHALVGLSMTLSSTCCWRRTGPNLS